VPRARTRHRWIALALGLAASLAVLALEAARVLEPVEAVVTDLQMRLRGPEPADPRVAIVAIDEESVEALGRWPWPRTCLAALIRGLDEAGARVIALDIVLSEPTRSPPGIDLSVEDRALAEAIREARGVVLGYFFRRGAAAGAAPSPAGSAVELESVPLAVSSAAVPASAAAAGPATPTAELVPAPTNSADAVCYAPPAGADDRTLNAPSFSVVRGGPYRSIARRPGAEPNLDLFEDQAAAQGFFSNEREEGVQRRYDLVIAHGERYYPALALSAVAEFLGEPLSIHPYQGVLPEVRIGERRVRADEFGRLWIDYRGPSGTFAPYPAVRVIDGSVPPGTFDGKLVFIGATETGIGDLAATPFGSEVPGVEMHANAADNLLNGRFLQDTALQYGWSLVALLAIGPLVALLVSSVERRRRYLLGSAAAIALVLAWPVVCHLAYRVAGWHLQVVPPVLAGGVALVAALRFQVGTVEARARWIRRAFQRYVSEAVVEEMLRDPERELALGGEQREMTVLFSDIRGFTTLAEGLPPEVVVRLLNEFFTPMTRLVLAEGGTLDKYMGDAMMAFFGAPVAQADHAARACAAALAMREELVRLNRRWRAEGRLAEGQELGIGIGLNSGVMSVGNMGSDQVFDYTVIGDNVNLGSRVEGLNKLYGSEILVTGATAEAAGWDFLFRELDRVRVKGKTEAVALFELLALRPAPADAEARAEAFAKGLEAYRRRRFNEAAETFQALVEAQPHDGPAAVFLARCRRYRFEPPPPDWDAVEVLTTK